MDKKIGGEKFYFFNIIRAVQEWRRRAGGASTALGLSRVAAALRGRSGVTARFETGRQGGLYRQTLTGAGGAHGPPRLILTEAVIL